jgi:hypothetical protein
MKNNPAKAIAANPGKDGVKRAALGGGLRNRRLDMVKDLE